jgi:hypothetical protein
VTLPDLVRCSGGLLVAQRRAGEMDLPASMLRVAEITDVDLPETAPIEVRRGDGVVWRRHWAERERLVIEFVGLTRVAVDDARNTVTFDRELPDETEEHLLFDHVLPLVLAQRGGLVVHGGVVSRAGAGAVLVGNSGAGKSTLAAYCWQQGWTLGNDDGAVLFPTDPPTVEPTYATLRLTPAAVQMLELSRESTSSVVGKIRLTGAGSTAFRQKRIQLSVIAVIEPGPASGEARFIPSDGIAAHAELFGSTFHADLSRDRRLPAVVDALASIIETTVVGRLQVPRGLDGLASTETLLRDLLGRRSHPDPAVPSIVGRALTRSP